MMSKGSIDPTKVVRAALQGAASVAGLLITTEAMVAELPQKKGQAIVGRGRHGRNGLLIDPGKQTGGASRSRPFVSVSSESRNPRWIAALYDSEDCASEFSGKIHFTQRVLHGYQRTVGGHGSVALRPALGGNGHHIDSTRPEQQ
jgi:hypothetical protein